MDMQSFLAEAKQRRTLANLSQKEVTKLCGFTKRGYGKFERGIYTPTDDEAALIRKALWDVEAKVAQTIPKSTKEVRVKKKPVVETPEIHPLLSHLDEETLSARWENKASQMTILKMILAQTMKGEKVTITILQAIKDEMKGSFVYRLPIAVGLVLERVQKEREQQ